MRIVVSGLAATYPYGGVFWDYVQYILGFRKLGHDVLYVEDTGQWCYDPEQGTFCESGARNAAYLAGEFKKLDPLLADCWFMRDGADECFGRDWASVRQFCRDADLLINVSASLRMREEYLEAARVALIDSDPMFTQAAAEPDQLDEADSEAAWRVHSLRDHHDVYFTFAENIGAADCKVPSRLFDWKPTRQPIDVDRLVANRKPLEARRHTMTTVASWETKQGGPVVGGVPYFGKNAEFMRFIDIPQSSPIPIEVALSGNAPRKELEQHGWAVVDPLPVTRTPADYIEYLSSSLGEFSIAKHAYAASRSGWFSCRTACYLALGVPAVVQETGFGKFIPTGEGLFSFDDDLEALAGLEAIASDPERHADAALAISRDYFDDGKVLSRLIEDAMDSEPKSVSAQGSDI